MALIMFKGQPIHTIGRLPITGDDAPDFVLTTHDLTEISLENLSGKRIILSIFPSIDTEVCSKSACQFNRIASGLKNVVILGISVDLPFALKRFCTQENITHITMTSIFRHPEFGTDYGVSILDGPLSGLLARAIIVINQDRKVLHSELVPEITQEPNYEQAFAALG